MCTNVHHAVRHRAGPGNFLNIHVSYVPTVHGEQKTKPTQNAVKSLRSQGLIPDLVGTLSYKWLPGYFYSTSYVSRKLILLYSNIVNNR